ncbi:DNA-methyltransferase [Stutzerimonas frequens]|uniref:DNA-methyltransferase n=1 Tax=Stutzerimonas frequens TaxID=2968969 RepID=UPI0012E2BBC3|nr:site-specific DNA-methyltransferase [Stutzerimonas frequens]MUT70830.1 site-specific DNA-methyltransferase [Stutzerimonas frequens]
MTYQIRDIKPITPTATLNREEILRSDGQFPIIEVARVTGMSPTFIRKVIGRNSATVSSAELLSLLDQDAFSETFVPRSRIPRYLSAAKSKPNPPLELHDETLVEGCSLDLISRLPPASVNCVVTSTPYWAMRLYEDMQEVQWADGESCPFGMEQTPEGFVRHSVEILSQLMPALADDGSIWWNLMDTFNTRTQVRTNASEALLAMKGMDKRGWSDHECRRYSAGHAYLKDGEQCMIPFLIAERASRLGYYVKSIISWTKTSSMPEPQNSRVSRNVEYVLHLAKQRTPAFNKEAYRFTPARLGGRNGQLESDKLSDFWHLPTSAGKDGHGAQFPLALPGRCISISTQPNDVVLDPFIGAGTTAVAAKLLGRKAVGFDVSSEYLNVARKRLSAIALPTAPATATATATKSSTTKDLMDIATPISE